jgi:polyvinyl alcohol dehydrogenase (cytochrome)
MMRITLRIVYLLVGLSAAVGARTTSAASTSAPSSGGDQPIAGKQLMLKDSPAAAKRSLSTLSSLSNDRKITLGGGNGSADDPTHFGGSLRVRTTTGDRFDSTYDLPTAGWRTIGAPGRNKGYRFTSKTGPINRIIVIPGRQVKVMGKGAFTATLSTDPKPVDVVLRTGATRYCMEFGRKARFRANKRFSATHAPAPASCPAVADWTTYGFDLTRNRFNPEEGLINAATVPMLDVRWFFSTGSGTAFVTASPSVVEGVVYIGAWNGTMYALDAFSGQPLWTFNINDPNPEDRGGFPGIQASATVVDGVVYFGAADANVYALDALTGAFKWKHSVGDPDPTVEGAHVWSSPAVFNGKVYVGKSSHRDAPCVRGAIIALDAATGAEVWRFDPLPERICGTDTQKPCTTDADCSGSSCVPFLVCRSGSGEQTQSLLCASDADCTAPATCQPPLGGGLTSSAAIDAGRGALYADFGDCVGSGNTGFSNSLVALDAETGALRWAFSPIPSGNLGDLDFISSPNLFTASIGTTPTPLVGVGSKNGVYYAVEQDTGALVWQQAVVPGGEAGGFSGSTGVASGKIYAGTFTGPPFIFALDDTNGAVAWQCPNTVCNTSSFGPAGIAAGVVFVGDNANQLRAFDAATGALLRTLDLGGAISSGPAVVNDMVYVGAGTGGLSLLGITQQQQQGVYGLALQRQGATTTTTTPGATTTTTLGTGTGAHTVMVGDGGALVYTPANLTIQVGDTVRWVWGSSGHSVVSGTNGNADNQFCSPSNTGCDNPPLSSKGATYEHTFTQAGTFPYYCSVHFTLGMTGTITVQ